jgi:Tfp pilus assembly protein FimT
MTSTTYRTITGEAGMSLAEILVASVIIAIGLVGLLSAVPVASYGISEGRNLSTASFLANQRLEQVRNAAWTASPANDCLGASASSTAAPTSAACNGAGVTTFSDETTMAAPYAAYARSVRITDCGVGAGCGGIVNSDLRQVAVTVSYTPTNGAGGAAPGSTKSAIVTMLVAKR